MTLSIPCPHWIGVNGLCVHLIELQKKPDSKEVDITNGKKVRDISCRAKTAKEEWKEREGSAIQAAPTRIKIFEGGSVSTQVLLTLVKVICATVIFNSSRISDPCCLFPKNINAIFHVSLRYKSNEDYVYVRGRGRGKYICEECGIRCKKPSMLKKHIRTHTDVRPYICRVCNFAFKTKGGYF